MIILYLPIFRFAPAFFPSRKSFFHEIKKNIKIVLYLILEYKIFWYCIIIYL